jgi:protein-tyrosine sulfotransferase
MFICSFCFSDGRASVHSMITRKVTVTGFDLTSYRSSLKKWNLLIKKMFVQCKALGDENCLFVHYERLVIYPKETMEMILKFLDIPWSDNVLHHEDFINKENGIILSK